MRLGLPAIHVVPDLASTDNPAALLRHAEELRRSAVMLCQVAAEARGRAELARAQARRVRSIHRDKRLFPGLKPGDGAVAANRGLER